MLCTKSSQQSRTGVLSTGTLPHVYTLVPLDRLGPETHRPRGLEDFRKRAYPKTIRALTLVLTSLCFMIICLNNLYTVPLSEHSISGMIYSGPYTIATAARPLGAKSVISQKHSI